MFASVELGPISQALSPFYALLCFLLGAVSYAFTFSRKSRPAQAYAARGDLVCAPKVLGL